MIASQFVARAGRSVGAAVAGTLVLVLVPACAGNDEAPTDARGADAYPSTTRSITADVGEVIETGSILVSDDRSAALGRVGDTIVIVDGLAGLTDGRDPSMTAWLVDALEPTTARSVDLSTLGPYWEVGVTTWGDDLAITGLRCPDTVDPPPPDDSIVEPNTNLESCGSVTWDLLRLSVGEQVEVQRLWSEVSTEGYGYRAPIGVTPAGDLLLGGVALESITPSGEVTELPTPDHSPIPCRIGDDLVSASETHPDGAGVNGSVRPITDYLTLDQIDGAVWQPVGVPTSEVTTRAAYLEGCARDSVVLLTVDVVVGDDGEIDSRSQGVHLLVAGDSGTLAWQMPPMDDLPLNRGDLLEVAVIDGRVVVGGMRSVGVEDEPPNSWFVAWDGDQWVDIGSDYGDLALFALPAPDDAVFTGDAALSADDLGLLYLGYDDWAVLATEPPSDFPGYYEPAQVLLGR